MSTLSFDVRINGDSYNIEVESELAATELRDAFKAFISDAVKAPAAAQPKASKANPHSYSSK